ncbi:hypothetical protein HPB51_010936 [Rhipicephalus microplus]|uniref:Uncharacterized protein n=1 Tax=Rhipicephalus microplus TaxID=6941 RepID=A0A9J6D544_RHIMP|nr:hypothetical protein HPB51_010936 [Rhipicephalus microplus]
MAWDRVMLTNIANFFGKWGIFRIPEEVPEVLSEVEDNVNEATCEVADSSDNGGEIDEYDGGGPPLAAETLHELDVLRCTMAAGEISDDTCMHLYGFQKSLLSGGLFQLVTLRPKAAQQKTMFKPTAGKPGGPISNDCARTAQPKGNLIKWRPCDTPKMSADDIIVVLKPCETLDLKTAFQTGDLGAAIAQFVGGEAAATLNV